MLPRQSFSCECLHLKNLPLLYKLIEEMQKYIIRQDMPVKVIFLNVHCLSETFKK
jgi:hypothetical protein